MKISVLVIFLTMSIVFLSTCWVSAQPEPNPPAPIPFDGGLIALLLAIAGVFGGKKVFNKFKDKEK